jgi:hypothetical protein
MILFSWLSFVMSQKRKFFRRFFWQKCLKIITLVPGLDEFAAFSSCPFYLIITVSKSPNTLARFEPTTHSFASRGDTSRPRRHWQYWKSLEIHGRLEAFFKALEPLL